MSCICELKFGRRKGETCGAKVIGTNLLCGIHRNIPRCLQQVRQVQPTHSQNTYEVTLNLSFRPRHKSDKIPSQVKNLRRYEPKEYVFWLLDYVDNTVVSAKWLNEKSISFVVTSTNSIKELKRELVTSPLEDGLYESSGNNGWVILSKDGNELGVMDYRSNPIKITKRTT